jgi:hypothetical protein
MGVCYAIVHDETREAFDLGKGPWWRWREVNYSSAEEEDPPFPPRSRDDLAAFVAEHTADWDVDDTYRSRTVDGMWRFIETHPGCRIERDSGDVIWKTEIDDEDRELWGDGVFREVGSRYEPA